MGPTINYKNKINFNLVLLEAACMWMTIWYTGGYFFYKIISFYGQTNVWPISLYMYKTKEILMIQTYKSFPLPCSAFAIISINTISIFCTTDVHLSGPEHVKCNLDVALPAFAECMVVFRNQDQPDNIQEICAWVAFPTEFFLL